MEWGEGGMAGMASHMHMHLEMLGVRARPCTRHARWRRPAHHPGRKPGQKTGVPKGPSTRGKPGSFLSRECPGMGPVLPRY